MKQVFNARRRVFIHDYDGVHYAYADFPDINKVLAEAKVLAAAALLPDLSADVAMQMGRDSFGLTGNGQGLFVAHAEKLGMDVDQFKRDFHLKLHEEAARIATQNHAHVFAQNDIINAHFETLRGYNVRHGLLTQSCLKHWATPFLTAMNRLHYFEEGARRGYAEMGYLTKAESTAPLAGIIEEMRAQFDEVVFIEDSLPNLEKAKELDDRIFTTFTCHAQPKDIVPDYVDLQTPTLDTFFTFVKDVYDKEDEPALARN